MPVAHGLIDPHDLSLPHLPDRLIGCRIAHVSDVHAWRTTNRWTRLANQLSGLRLDLVVFTGDYGHDRRHEEFAFAALKQMTDNLRPALGCFGVFGNHDHPALRQLVRSLPITWLVNQTLRLDGVPLELVGLDSDHPESADAVAAVLDGKLRQLGRDRVLRVCAAHRPEHIMTAADIGCDLMLCGHTHGGQCRLPTGRPLVNCTGLPLRLTAGIMRHRDTIVALTRGCGSHPMPPRLFCRPHVPIYTLRKGPMPGRHTDTIENILPW